MVFKPRRPTGTAPGTEGPSTRAGNRKTHTRAREARSGARGPTICRHFETFCLVDRFAFHVYIRTERTSPTICADKLKRFVAWPCATAGTRGPSQMKCCKDGGSGPMAGGPLAAAHACVSPRGAFPEGDGAIAAAPHTPPRARHPAPDHTRHTQHNPHA